MPEDNTETPDVPMTVAAYGDGAKQVLRGGQGRQIQVWVQPGCQGNRGVLLHTVERNWTSGSANGLEKARRSVVFGGKRMQFLVDFALRARNSLNKQPTRDFVGPMEMGERIPRVLHQTFSVGPCSPDFPPELHRRNEKLKKENPNWEIRFYDDEEIARYIGENFPKLRSYYDRIDPRYGAARADFFRYLAVKTNLNQLRFTKSLFILR